MTWEWSCGGAERRALCAAGSKVIGTAWILGSRSASLRLPVDDESAGGFRLTTSPVSYIPHRNAAVCTGASQNLSISASSMVSVIEQPAMSRLRRSRP